MSGSGRLALVFDDGYAADYEQIRPILVDVDATASFAIVSGWLGSDGHLTWEQVRSLVDEGCEVLAHGCAHRYVAPHRLVDGVDAGDRRVPLAGHVFPDDHAGVVPGDAYELTNGARRVTVEVADKGREAGVSFVELAEPLDASWSRDETVFRLPHEGLEAEIAGAAEALAAEGFDTRSFVFPYDAADVRALRIARREYDVVPNAAVRSLPNPPGTPGWNLRRYYLETDTLTRVEIEDYLDAVAEDGGLGILAGHSGWETVPVERVRFAIDAARARGIEVTTLTDAITADGVV